MTSFILPELSSRIRTLGWMLAPKMSLSSASADGDEGREQIDSGDAEVDSRVSGEEAAFGRYGAVGNVTLGAGHANQEDAGHQHHDHDEDGHDRGDTALVRALTPRSVHVGALPHGFLSLTSEVRLKVCAGWLGTLSRVATAMTMRRTAPRAVVFAKLGTAARPWPSSE